MNTALILAGGLGTRLRSMVSDLPKPLAPVNGKPFLHYILHTLAAQGIERCVLSIGYKAALIQQTFGEHYAGLRLDYVVEQQPLGTGGALRLAAQQIDGDFFLLNGDTLAELSLLDLAQTHHQRQADITLSLVAVDDLSRYGSVILDANARVTGFAEKQAHGGSGLINAGAYAIAQRALQQMPPPGEVFSLERFLEKHTADLAIFGTINTGYFIDIGIPEDYQRAQHEFTVRF